MHKMVGQADFSPLVRVERVVISKRVVVYRLDLLAVRKRDAHALSRLGVQHERAYKVVHICPFCRGVAPNPTQGTFCKKFLENLQKPLLPNTTVFGGLNVYYFSENVSFRQSLFFGDS